LGAVGEGVVGGVVEEAVGAVGVTKGTFAVGTDEVGVEVIGGITIRVLSGSARTVSEAVRGLRES